MSEEKDDILEILSDFKEKKERRETEPDEPLQPPKRRDGESYIDFARTEEGEEAEEAERKTLFKRKKEPKPEKTPEEIEALKAQKQEKRKSRKNKAKTVWIKVKNAVFNKKVLAAVAALAVITAAVFGIRYGVEQAKVAYLKPYQEKYPDVEFPAGILEKYCEAYGENPDTAGYIEIPDIHLKSTVSRDTQTYPYAQPCTDGCEQFNYVVYLNDDSLEDIYSSAEGYNSASGYMTYSNLFQDYTFKIVGAFYTNTKAQDDSGYIFPYNVTEKMTADSQNEYISRLQSRFIYSTGIDITRQDTILTVSCPTDYRADFRFVVIGVMRENTGSKLTAEEKSDVHYPQIIYDETNTENPYRFSSQWYPEIIVTDSEGTQTTIQKTIEDYEQ